MTSDHKTIFVRNLPFSCTLEQLRETFSSFGEVRNCFLVREKGEVDGCRGLGYVTFNDVEVLHSVLKREVRLDGRKIYTHLSRNKKDKSKESDNYNIGKEDHSNPNTSLANRILVVRNIIGDVDELNDKIKNLAGFLSIKKIEDDLLGGKGKEVILHIMFSGHKDAVKGLNILSNGKLKGWTKSVNLMSSERKKNEVSEGGDKKAKVNKEVLSKKEEQKRNDVDRQKSYDKSKHENSIKSQGKPRLVIRNLSFQCRERHLKSSFSKFGKVSDIKILKKNGKMSGCAFVEMSSMRQAAKALKSLNGKKIRDRPVAVDWAVPKSRYEQENMNNDEKEDSEEVSSIDEEDDHDKTGNNDEDNGDSDDEGSNDDDESNSKDEESSDDDSGVSSQCDAAIKKQEFEDDGKTLFLRNLPYDVAEEDVLDLFKKHGPVQYVSLCYDNKMQRPRGTGFIRFYKKETSDLVLDKCKDDSDPIMIDGRRVDALPAVNKDAANKVATAGSQGKEKGGKDNRNLHLIREGMIRAGTQAAEGLTDVELKRREELMVWKKQRLRNTNYFLSPTRLCVRNLPLSVEDAELRRVFKHAALKEDGGKVFGSVWVKEAKVMRDMNRLSSDGKGKSRRYGFVEFTEHSHALNALRASDNHELFKGGGRLIVEFSVENIEAVNKKKRREDKSRQGKTGGKVNTRVITSKMETGDKVNLKNSGLPSHLGPKLRHRDRGKMQSKKIQKKRIVNKIEKDNNIKPERVAQVKDRKKRKPKKKGIITDNFDKLVEKHKAKLFDKRASLKWDDE